MTIIEKAYKVRNLWNRWNDYNKQEVMLALKIDKVDEEISNATYSKNGYEHFKTFGHYLNKEEVMRQRSYLIEQHEKSVSHMERITEELKEIFDS